MGFPMLIAVDFDSTIVQQTNAYDDVTSPLEFVPGAREGLKALKDAGHLLILWSSRSNLALRRDWRLNPLWRDSVVPFYPDRWEKQKPLQEARFQQMVDFVARELPGMFAAIDDGAQGKVMAHLFLDDRAFGYVKSEYFDWSRATKVWGV